uniref:Uncharacterized protein n=1 Tax=Vombatus ursinus TaxID=29139 RepID=A0A4X2K2F0_VOMUR
MAQRMVLRRFLAPVLSRKLPQCCWVPRPPEFLAQGSSGRPAAAPSLTRPFSTTKISKVIFDVQDRLDFQVRGVNSETLEVVDFHAQCVFALSCLIPTPLLPSPPPKETGEGPVSVGLLNSGVALF